MKPAVLLLLLFGGSSLGWTTPSWKEEVGAFLDVLTRDPRHSQAHAYIEKTLRQAQLRRNIRVKEERLKVLSGAARRLETVWVDIRPLENAILETTDQEERLRQQRWDAECEEADMEMHLGHFLSAHERVFRVLAEHPGHIRAQQLLAELQGRLQPVLKNGSLLTSEERFSLEGFDAYGRADYETAAAAWKKALALLQQSYSPAQLPQRLAALHFEPYWKTALGHISERRLTAETQSLFQRASALYAQGRFADALHVFRKTAVLNPDYPQLGSYLAQTEAALEKDRARRLGEQKQKEIARLFEKGFALLQSERYGDAERALQQVVSMDPAHVQARSYLALVQTELHRRHDPKAADQHYEAGLIAYAGGKLEEAVREWSRAIRLNPSHPKALYARAKVQKELALSDEALP
jgi:tetratricopeptide (TPR) repeat protein